MTTERSSSKRPGADAEEAEALLAACRVLVAVSAQSIAAVEDVADMTQVRALVIVASRGSVSLAELANAGHLHLTRASRLVDRLVVDGLMNRVDDPTNRRQVALTLTAAGERVVRRVMQRRREAIAPILAALTRQMTKGRRSELVALLREFAVAGGDPSDSDLWAMGWTT